MNAAFLNEWQLYRRGAQLPPIVGLEPKTDSEFDADVAVGEVRIFADTNRPLVALVVEDRRLSGWRIVPVSPFCAPASDRELMVGERVFQLWNATVVSRRFASRSWRVDAISDSDLAEIRCAIAAANPGRVTAGDGVQAKYEREFLVGEGTLVPFAEPRAADLPRFGWMQISLKIAASLALCLVAWYVLMMDSGRQIVRNWRGGFHSVDIAQEDATIDLVDAREVREAPTEIAEVNIDFTPPSVTWYGPAPEVFRPAKFADVKGPKVPESIKKFTLDRDRFISPISAPMEVVFLSGGERKSHAPAQSGELRYAAAIAPLAEPPKVTCKLVNDTRSGLCVDKILRIEGEVAEGAKITVMFDWDVVEGYGKLSSTASDCKVWINYELMAFSGKTISPESVFVTLIWPSKDGDERTPVPV
nr:hypothetical protein [Kiritimatiellia bacterium]